ncbi:hypothetical protein, partial [Pseudokineococcus marinus]
MPITTTRRAASTGLGVLAATTALAVAAPSASAATTTYELAPAPDELVLALSGTPADPALLQDETFLAEGLLPVPASGAVALALPSSVAEAGTGAQAAVLSADQLEDFDGTTLPADALATTDQIGLDVVEGVLAFELDTAALAAVPAVAEADGELVVVVGGLVAPALPDVPPVTLLPLDVLPEAPYDAPALELAGVLAAASFATEPLELTAGQPLEVTVPDGSAYGTLGLTTLVAEGLLLLPLDEETYDELGIDVEGLAGLAGGMSPAAGGSRMSPSELSEELAPLADELSDLADVEVAPDGRSAVVTPAADLPAGEYLLTTALLPEGVDVESGEVPDTVGTDIAPVVLTAAAPAPAPAPTATATPAPATPAPPAQNEGLRSNTGVEGGGVDGGLVAVGAGLLAV